MLRQRHQKLALLSGVLVCLVLSGSAQAVNDSWIPLLVEKPVVGNQIKFEKPAGFGCKIVSKESRTITIFTFEKPVTLRLDPKHHKLCVTESQLPKPGRVYLNDDTGHKLFKEGLWLKYGPFKYHVDVVAPDSNEEKFVHGKDMFFVGCRNSLNYLHVVCCWKSKASFASEVCATNYYNY